LARHPEVRVISRDRGGGYLSPALLRRLYVARGNDAAGIKAAERLHERGNAAGIEVRDLVPVHDDVNADLCILGPAAMLAHVAAQLIPADLTRFARAGELRQPA